MPLPKSSPELLAFDLRRRDAQWSVTAQVRRGLLAVAGASPLLASPMLSHAHADPPQPTASAPAVQHPTSSPGITEPSPPAQASAVHSSPAASTATPTAAGAAAAAPQLDDLSLAGTSVWVGLLDKQVWLAMKSGPNISGRLLAQSSAELRLVRAGDEDVVSVRKSEIAGVRQIDVPRDERRVATKHRRVGTAMVVVGSVAIVAGTAIGVYDPPNFAGTGPSLIAPGVGMISAGAVMLVRAKKIRKVLEKPWGGPSAARMQMVPTVVVGRRGGQAGLVLRF